MELPIELVCEIALKDPKVYLLLVQTCRSVRTSIKIDVMKYFMSYRKGGTDDLFPDQLAWRLPNGALHSPDIDTPALVFDCKLERSYSGIESCIRPCISNHSNSFYITTGKHIRLFKKFIEEGLEDGDKFWFNCNKLHRGNDLPAITTNDSEKFWFVNNLLHRDYDRPAITEEWICQSYSYCYHAWYHHGELHRSNKNPAKLRREEVLQLSGNVWECKKYYEYGVEVIPNSTPWYLADFE